MSSTTWFNGCVLRRLSDRLVAAHGPELGKLLWEVRRNFADRKQAQQLTAWILAQPETVRRECARWVLLGPRIVEARRFSWEAIMGEAGDCVKKALRGDSSAARALEQLEALAGGVQKFEALVKALQQEVKELDEVLSEAGVVRVDFRPPLVHGDSKEQRSSASVTTPLTYILDCLRSPEVSVREHLARVSKAYPGTSDPIIRWLRRLPERAQQTAARLVLNRRFGAELAKHSCTTQLDLAKGRIELSLLEAAQLVGDDVGTHKARAALSESERQLALVNEAARLLDEERPKLVEAASALGVPLSELLALDPLGF